MENRPTILKGLIHIEKEYIIGKVIKNKNVLNKCEYIQILDNENINLFEGGYKAYIFEQKPEYINAKDYCEKVNFIDTLHNFDVIEIIKDATTDNDLLIPSLEDYKNVTEK